MPKGLASIDAAKALLDYVQGGVPEDSHQYPHIGLGVFEHSGMKMRGLSATKPFQPEDSIVSLPSEFGATTNDVNGLRFQGASSPKMALALWVAEKKAEFANPEMAGQSFKSQRAHDFWERAIANYPKLSHFESIGLPLAAQNKDLELLDGLPVFGRIPYWVRQTRGQLAQALAWYNEYREGHPVLKWEDALWGRIILSAYSFGTDGDECGTHLSPVADLIDHSMNNNAHFDCNPEKNNIEIVADRDIQPGEELTIAYKRQPLSNFQFYGILDEPTGHLPQDPFTTKGCSALRNAHLELSRSPLGIGASKLIDLHCPKPGSIPEDTQAQLTASAQISKDGHSSSWPDEKAEMDKMAEMHGEKLAEKELAGMSEGEIAKLAAEAEKESNLPIGSIRSAIAAEEKNPTSPLEASGLPFSEKTVASAAMPSVFMLAPTISRARRADTASFLDCPKASSLTCRARLPHRPSGQQARRSCSGGFQWYDSANLVSGY